jgi:hypothetical protein
MEEAIIKQIRINLKAIQKGIPAKDTNIGYSLNKLKTVNEGLYIDYLEEYKNILAKLKK